MVFPLYPDGWTMQLVKKSSSCPVLPTGIVDQPKDRAQVSAMMAVSGWVTASEPVGSVFIYLDGALKASLKPDVRAPTSTRSSPTLLSEIRVGGQLSIYPAPVPEHI